MHHGDAHGFELCDVQNFSRVQVVNMAVGDEVEVGAANGTGGGQAHELRATFQNCCARNARAVGGKFESGDARRANSVLNGDEATVVPIETIGAGESGVRARIYVGACEIFEIDANDADGIGDEKSFVVRGECDAVWIEKLAMYGERRERLFAGVEAEDFIVQAIGEDDFAGLADNEVVKTVPGGIVDSESAEKNSGWVEVNEFGSATGVFHGVGPDGVVPSVKTDAEHWKKMIAARGNKIRSVTVGRDLDDFSLREAAEIKNFAIRVPGETLGDEIFFFGDQDEAGLPLEGKIAMNFFDELRKFAGSMQRGKFRIAGRIKTFA